VRFSSFEERRPLQEAQEEENVSGLGASIQAIIDKDAWESLNSAISMPFEKPNSGRIAVELIDHPRDQVRKVFRVRRFDI
jgi:hypothetical protein